MSAREGFGKAKEGSGIVFFKVGEDETKQFRIFPPKGKLATDGKWALYHQQHYGYSVPVPNDPSKTYVRPFLCVEEKDGDRVVVSCPECRKIEDRERMMKEQFEAETARLVGQNVNKEEAEKMAAKYVEAHRVWLKGGEKGKGGHNLDRKWYILAMAEDGQIGYLLIPHKAKKSLDQKKKKLLADEGIDILDIDKGAWIEITRTGNFRSTEYEVSIAQEHTTVNGVRAKVVKVSGFSEEQLATALALPDLDSGSLVRKLSRDQIRMLTEGSGAPEEVEAILNMGQRVTRKEEIEQLPPRAAPVASSPAIQVHTAPMAAPPAGDPQAAAIAALQAQLASLMAAPKPVPATQPSATNVEAVKKMSDEDFLAKFGPAK